MKKHTKQTETDTTYEKDDGNTVLSSPYRTLLLVLVHCLNVLAQENVPRVHALPLCQSNHSCCGRFYCFWKSFCLCLGVQSLLHRRRTNQLTCLIAFLVRELVATVAFREDSCPKPKLIINLRIPRLPLEEHRQKEGKSWS